MITPQEHLAGKSIDFRLRPPTGPDRILITPDVRVG
jgi:hypothetical protein